MLIPFNHLSIYIASLSETDFAVSNHLNLALTAKIQVVFSSHNPQSDQRHASFLAKKLPYVVKEC